MKNKIIAHSKLHRLEFISKTNAFSLLTEETKKKIWKKIASIQMVILQVPVNTMIRTNFFIVWYDEVISGVPVFDVKIDQPNSCRFRATGTW